MRRLPTFQLLPGIFDRGQTFRAGAGALADSARPFRQSFSLTLLASITYIATACFRMLAFMLEQI